MTPEITVDGGSGRRPPKTPPMLLVLILVAAIFGAVLVSMRMAREIPTEKPGALTPASAGPAAAAMAPQRATFDAGTIQPGGFRASQPPGSSTKPAPSIRLSGSRPRSPLENSPGYDPPEDPESLSVITGRRAAKAVGMPFSGGASTREDLAQMLLAALSARDEKALHALRVTKEEFSVILWPEFPESRPITNITADDAWGMAIAQSVAGAGRAVGQYGGKDLTLLRVEGGPPMAYRNFVLRRDVSLLVRDRSTGVESRLNFAPSFVERNGRVKVLIFHD